MSHDEPQLHLASMAQSINTLFDLADAFRNTGNTLVAAELYDEAKCLVAAHKGLRDHINDLTMEMATSAHQSSINLFNTAMAVSSSIKAEKGGE